MNAIAGFPAWRGPVPLLQAAPAQASQAGRQPCQPALTPARPSGAHPEEHPPHGRPCRAARQAGLHCLHAHGRGRDVQGGAGGGGWWVQWPSSGWGLEWCGAVTAGARGFSFRYRCLHAGYLQKELLGYPLLINMNLLHYISVLVYFI